VNQIGRLNMDTSCLAWGNKKNLARRIRIRHLPGFYSKGRMFNARHGCERRCSPDLAHRSS
jgi:hypothetical protein